MEQHAETGAVLALARLGGWGGHNSSWGRGRCPASHHTIMQFYYALDTAEFRILPTKVMCKQCIHCKYCIHIDFFINISTTQRLAIIMH